MDTILKKLWILFLLATPLAAQSNLPMMHAGGVNALSLNPGWTFVQDSPFFQCSATGTSCNPGSCASANSCWAKTTAGTVRVIFLETGNANIHIASVTQTGETWNLCGSTACKQFLSGSADIDAAYSFGASSGEDQTTLTVNYSGAATGFVNLVLTEILPPSGCSTSLDNVAVSPASSSCTACTAANPTITATDAIIQAVNEGQSIAWNGWNSGYITTMFQDGICLNCISGSTPTVTQSPAGYMVTSGLAFKSSCGTFTTPAPVFSLVNVGATGISGSLKTCTAGACPAITIPSTTAGNLGVFAAVASAATQYLSSISGGGTWTCPTAAPGTAGSLRAHDSSNNYMSICYNLSLTGSVTSITPTMQGTSNISYAYYEVHRNDANSFVLDQAASTDNASGTNFPVGQALNSLTGTNDVIFSGGVGEGGFGPMTLFPQGTPQQFTPSAGGDAGMLGVLLNTTNGNAPVFPYPSESSVATGVMAVAFK